MALELKHKKCKVVGENGVLRCISPTCPLTPHKEVLREECIVRTL